MRWRKMLDRDDPYAMIGYYEAVKNAASSYAAFVASCPVGKASEIDEAAAAYVEITEAGKVLRRFAEAAK